MQARALWQMKETQLASTWIIVLTRGVLLSSRRTGLRRILFITYCIHMFLYKSCIFALPDTWTAELQKRSSTGHTVSVGLPHPCRDFFSLLFTVKWSDNVNAYEPPWQSSSSASSSTHAIAQASTSERMVSKSPLGRKLTRRRWQTRGALLHTARWQSIGMWKVSCHRTILKHTQASGTLANPQICKSST